MIFASAAVRESPTLHNTLAAIIFAMNMHPPSKQVEKHVSAPTDALKSHEDQPNLHRKSFGRSLPINWAAITNARITNSTIRHGGERIESPIIITPCA